MFSKPKSWCAWRNLCISLILVFNHSFFPLVSLILTKSGWHVWIIIVEADSIRSYSSENTEIIFTRCSCCLKGMGMWWQIPCVETYHLTAWELLTRQVNSKEGNFRRCVNKRYLERLSQDLFILRVLMHMRSHTLLGEKPKVVSSVLWKVVYMSCLIHFFFLKKIYP